MSKTKNKEKKYVEEIENGLYAVRGTGHSKDVLNYTELTKKITQKGYLISKNIENAKERLINLSREIKECFIYQQNFYKEDCELFYKAFCDYEKQLAEKDEEIEILKRKNK